jgi:hypothetical protein
MSSPSRFIDKSLSTQHASNDQLDDAEKGILDTSGQLPIFPPAVMTREVTNFPLMKATSTSAQGGFIPALSSTTTLGRDEKPQAAISEKPSVPSPKPPVRHTRRRTKFRLWFNTYRRFFVFCVTLNGVGIVLAALDKFPYARNHLGALVLGNLLMAILMRNELFLRFLYLIAIHGLRWVS